MAPAKRLLIVEDDAAIRSSLADLLRSEGYEVFVAPNGVEGLRLLREHAPDLVLLDLMLPDMNGWTLLRQRERERGLTQVPVLVLSASGPEGIANAQELGAPVFLTKPFDIERLLAEVQKLCAGPVRQCAWCGQVMDDTGEFRLRSGRKLRWATHGICPTCKAKERQELLR